MKIAESVPARADRSQALALATREDHLKAVVAVKQREVNAGRELRSQCRSTSTDYSKGSLLCREFRSGNTRTCRPVPMDRCFIWKQDAPALVAVVPGAAAEQAMNYCVIACAIVVRIRSSAMSLLTR